MPHLLLVYAHLLSTVFLVGFALFGAILTWAGADGALVERTYRWPWPPKGLPVPVSLPVFGLGWAAFLVTAGTGAALYAGRGAGTEGFVVKLALVALVFLAHVGVSLRPRGGVLVANFLLVLGVVAVSATLAR